MSTELKGTDSINGEVMMTSTMAENRLVLVYS